MESRIKTLREKRGIIQEILAAELGITQQMFCKVLNRICDVSVECDAHVVADRCIIRSHSLTNPVEHDSDKTVFVKISDEIFLFVSKKCFF